MENTSKGKTPTRRDLAYYRQRQKNRVFTALANFFAQEAESGKISKKELAEKLSKDPSQITRWLSAPSNFELDTLSDILLAMGAEMDHSIVRFSERAKPNSAHPLVAEILGDVSLLSNMRRPDQTLTETKQPELAEIKVERAPAGVKIIPMTPAGKP